jgi:SAM-dependent methyltransferase
MKNQTLFYRDTFIHYNKVKNYEKEYDHGNYSFFEWELEKSVLEILLKRHLQEKATNHLDFACGTGRVTQFMMPFAHHTLGVDISPAMTELAKAKCPKARFLITDITVDPEELKHLGPFDLITVFRFLAPAENDLRIAVLKILVSCLLPNGLLIINNNANLTSLLYPTLLIRSLLGRPFKNSINYIQALPYRNLTRLLNSVGMDIVEAAGVCFIPRLIAGRLPRFLWYPLEKALSRINPAPPLAVNQIVVAKKHSLGR